MDLKILNIHYTKRSPDRFGAAAYIMRRSNTIPYDISIWNTFYSDTKAEFDQDFDNCISLYHTRSDFTLVKFIVLV